MTPADDKMRVSRAIFNCDPHPPQNGLNIRGACGRPAATGSTRCRSVAHAEDESRRLGFGRSAASASGNRRRASQCAAGLLSVGQVAPGRSITANGTSSAISRQRCQRCSWGRIRPHDPHEAHVRAAPPEVGHGIVGVAGADLGLEAGDDDAGIACKCPRRGNSRAERRQARRLLQRVAGTDHHQTRSRPIRFRARSLAWTCPRCGGLKEPPKRPTRKPGGCGGRRAIGTGAR